MHGQPFMIAAIFRSSASNGSFSEETNPVKTCLGGLYQMCPYKGLAVTEDGTHHVFFNA
jgi:hypothetical protein